MSIQVTKADGAVETFKVEKLRRSLRRSGAQPEEINDIVAAIEKRLHNGITTQEIYREAFELLQRSDHPQAARYSLRRALFRLGPTGFPFETFLARLFEAKGYTTKTGVMLQGKCTEHEIDLAAYNKDHSFVAEAKFHSRSHMKSDLQVSMYTYARFLDLQSQRICQEDICGVTEFRIITNTKFTTAATDYATCVGLPLLSWTFPKKGNLHDLIQETGVYPLTVLHSLSANQVKALIARNLITCQDVLENQGALQHLHLSKKKVAAILHEAQTVCSS